MSHVTAELTPIGLAKSGIINRKVTNDLQVFAPCLNPFDVNGLLFPWFYQYTCPRAHFGNEAGHNLIIDHSCLTHRTEDDTVFVPRTSYYVQPCMSGTRQRLIDRIDD